MLDSIIHTFGNAIGAACLAVLIGWISERIAKGGWHAKVQQQSHDL